jgi:hypothetical protein
MKGALGPALENMGTMDENYKASLPSQARYTALITSFHFIRQTTARCKDDDDDDSSYNT